MPGIPALPNSCFVAKNGVTRFGLINDDIHLSICHAVSNISRDGGYL